jgi:2-keto-3-deoxy-L-rhamnonate aldolase RhmA
MNKSFVEILKSGRTAVGVAFSMPLPGAIERFGHEWDWVWIDGQHGVIGYPEILSMVRWFAPAMLSAWPLLSGFLHMRTA